MANLTITDDESMLSDSANLHEHPDVYKKCFTLRDYYKQCLSFYHKGEQIFDVLSPSCILQFQKCVDNVFGIEDVKNASMTLQCRVVFYLFFTHVFEMC